MKNFFNNKFLPWFKTNWLELLNIIILLVVYGLIEKVLPETIIGLWIFTLLAYYFFKYFKKNKK